ncbi:MAG TPA: septal ring lytic transglycosylase RlpA family protein [Candidatus Binataceae bacterium]
MGQAGGQIGGHAGGVNLRSLVRRAAIAAVTGFLFSACATYRAPAPAPSERPAPPPIATPGTGSILGIASWYGPGFNGRPTASGKIYDQEDLTAASELFVLGTRVMVTNLDTNRSVEVTINDRGPYAKGRKIDLSHKAALVLGMIGPGTARVRMDVLSAPPGSRPAGSPMRYYVQIGSFSRSGNADQLRTRLASYYPDVRVERLEAGQRRYYRVRMGAFTTRAAAQERATSSARFGLPIVIVSE